MASIPPPGPPRRFHADPVVSTGTYQLIMTFLEENPKEVKAAILRADHAARARAATDRAAEARELPTLG